MRLNWMKCQGNVWCKLNFVNLDHSHFDNKSGIYIIWHGGKGAAVVYVGHGNIRDRLSEHRKDPEIQQYDALELYVTWAAVPSDERDGVEAYLADAWSPKVGARHPEAIPIEVNSPW